MRDLDEVDSRDAGPTGSSGRTLLGLLGIAVAAAVLFGQLTAPDPPARPPTAIATTHTSNFPTTPEPDRPIGVESLKRCPLSLGALTLGDDRQQRGWAIDVWDCDALMDGPWSLVIRASDGHFGVRSAVVTFPAPTNQVLRSPTDLRLPLPQHGESSTPVTKPPGGRWSRDSQSLIWPLGGSQALIVGDLGQAQLADLAMHIIVVDGRPRLSSPDWFQDRFAPESETTFRSPATHHVRYQIGDLGQERQLGNGQLWTGVTTGAFLESMVFVEHAKPAGLVRGHPAVYSSSLYPQWLSFGPDSGTLAWESTPGEVTYIGFSGTATEAVAIEALRELANKGKMLTLDQWGSRDRAQVDSQPDRRPLDVPGLGPG